MNLPNSLTLLRIFFVPVLIVILLTRSPNFEFWGFSMHFEVWGVLILLPYVAASACVLTVTLHEMLGADFAEFPPGDDPGYSSRPHC